PANSSSNRIVVSNAGIKAWNANTTKVRLEYYFERVGQVSVGAFRRDFKNFFGSTVIPSTPEFLALYNLDPEEYLPYSVSHELQSLESRPNGGARFRLQAGFDVSAAVGTGRAGVCQRLGHSRDGRRRGEFRRLRPADLQLGRESVAAEVQPAGELELQRQ